MCIQDPPPAEEAQEDEAALEVRALPILCPARYAMPSYLARIASLCFSIWFLSG